MSQLTLQDYYLVKIQEELAEVSHVISKALRFGIRDSHPRTGEVNKDRLESEIKDLLVALNEAAYRGYINIPEIPEFNGYNERQQKLDKYKMISKQLGRLE